MIKSKLTFILIPLTVLMAFASGVILFLVYIIVVSNVSNLTDFDIAAGILFLTWIALMPMVMMLTLMRNYVTHSDKLEVNYFFGLVKHFYSYKDLRISDYAWSTKGFLIALPDGDQMTLGKNQYRNFDEITKALGEKIQSEKIEVKYTTKVTRLLLIIGGISLILMLIGLQFQK
jgi:hypothetical protein